MAINQGKILIKSPYYITENGLAGFTSEIEIRVWNGSFTSEPTNPIYSLDKQALSTTSTTVIYEIAKLVGSFIKHDSNVYNTSNSTHEDALWVNVKSFGGTTNRNDTWLILDGYSYFEDGINSLMTSTTLISERILYHYEGIPLRVPVYVNGLTDAAYVRYRKGGVIILTDDFSLTISSTNSYDKIYYSTQPSGTELPGDIDNIIVTNSIGTILDTITVIPGRCTKYTPYIVSFINKLGVLQELVFGLVSKENISTSKKSYTRQLLDFSGGAPVYNTRRHQTKDYNSSVREGITLNIDYIDESLNNTIGELISSESVWVKELGGITLPVNVKTNSLQYKKSVNEGLISYTIDFDYAFNKINNIY